MAVELINDHVLLTCPADWGAAPSWSREWGTEVATSVLGGETRVATRAVGRVGLTWMATAEGVRRIELDDQVRAAKKAGLAAAAYHGRACVLVDTVAPDETEVRLTGAWTWKAGDYVLLDDLDGRPEAHLVEAAVIEEGVWRLTLAEETVGKFYAGTPAWPVLFGKFEVKEITGASGEVATFELSIRERVGRDSVQVGEMSEPGDGIGAWAVADTFEVQPGAMGEPVGGAGGEAMEGAGGESMEGPG